MSLNLGPVAFEAVSQLKHTPEWRAFKSALQDQMSKLMHAAVDVGDAAACGYARALRDVVWAIEVIEAGPGQGVVAAKSKPLVKDVGRTAAN